MLRIRLLVAWLMLLLVPLQGLAAASKFCCVVQSSHHASSDPTSSFSVGKAALAAHHGGTAPATQYKNSRALLGEARPVSPDLGHDASEGCGVCASLCHAVGITQAFAASPTAAMRPVNPVEGLLLAPEQPFTVADKPPRARRV